MAFVIQNFHKILKANNCYSETKMNQRIRSREAPFEHLHTIDVKCIKEKRILIELISNCFSEEATIIKKSILYPYFDAVYLFFDEGLQKPHPAIFKRRLEMLDVTAEN